MKNYQNQAAALQEGVSQEIELTEQFLQRYEFRRNTFNKKIEYREQRDGTDLEPAGFTPDGLQLYLPVEPRFQPLTDAAMNTIVRTAKKMLPEMTHARTNIEEYVFSTEVPEHLPRPHPTQAGIQEPAQSQRRSLLCDSQTSGGVIKNEKCRFRVGSM